MKIFYAYASKEIGGDNQSQNSVQVYLADKGHKVKIYNYVFSEETEPGEFDMDPSDIIAGIKKCDVFIGEMSKASQTMGFLLAFAMFSGKPSLYLYPEGTLAKPGRMLSDHPSRLLRVESYKDQKELLETLDDFLVKAERQKKSSRVIFVGTQEINQFISKRSIETGLSKSEAIRAILEEEMSKETEE